MVLWILKEILGLCLNQKKMLSIGKINSDYGKRIFEAQILLSNENIGLQSSKIGWIKAVNTKTLIKIISRFDIYKYPILII